MQVTLFSERAGHKSLIMSQHKFPALPVKIVKRFGRHDSYDGEWSMSERDGEHLYLQGFHRKEYAGNRDVEAAEIFNALLGIRIPADGLAFHSAYGFFASDQKYRLPVVGMVEPLRIISFSSLCWWRDCLKKLSVMPLSKWMEKTPICPFEGGIDICKAPEILLQLTKRGAPIGTVVCDEGRDAVLSMLKIEKAGGAEFRWCARTDCVKGIFRIESGHSRIYCSTRCAHIVAVRNSRARSKTKVTTRKSRVHRKRDSK
jgi:hypothetical protein